MARLKSLPWHGAATEAVARLLARGVHALLLHGQAGIGKLDLALDTAEALLCESPQADRRACGQCAGCALVAAGNHPDLRTLRPAALVEQDGERAGAPPPDAAAEGAGGADGKAKASREIRIEQVRELSEWANLTTHRAGARVIVIEPAESMTTPAANALLKLLEEPPPATVFLVVSHRVSETLATIRSRCVLVPVAGPGREAAVRWLQQQGLPEPGRRLVEAGGAPLLALQAEREGLPGELRERLVGLLRKGGGLTPADVVSGVPRDVPVAGAVALFQRWGWDYLAFKLAGVVRYHPEDIVAFRQLGTRWRAQEACGWLGELQWARAFADHPLNAKLAVEGMLLSYVRSIGQTPWPVPAPERRMTTRSGLQA
jgi:DNA polymerase III subunit delta'